MQPDRQSMPTGRALAVMEPDHPDVVTLRNNLEEGPTRTRSLGIERRLCESFRR
jgi:hypothetical protein